MSETGKVRTKRIEWRNLILFFLIAFAWTWSWWWLLFLSGWVETPAELGTQSADLGSISPLIILLVAISPFGPTIAGFLMTALTVGKKGVHALWKRLWKPKVRWTWWLVIFLTWPALRLATTLLGRLLDGQQYPLLANPDQVWVFLPALFVSTFINGGMSEEFGWRGYALPRLQSKFSALSAAVILGIVEGLWHYPLILMGQWWQESVVELIFWFILTDILRAWIFNNAGGNLLAMMFFHGMGNTQSDIIWCCGSRAHIYWVYGLATLLVTLVFGWRNLVLTKEKKKRFSDLFELDRLLPIAHRVIQLDIAINLVVGVVLTGFPAFSNRLLFGYQRLPWWVYMAFGAGFLLFAIWQIFSFTGSFDWKDRWAHLRAAAVLAWLPTLALAAALLTPLGAALLPLVRAVLWFCCLYMLVLGAFYWLVAERLRGN